ATSGDRVPRRVWASEELSGGFGGQRGERIDGDDPVLAGALRVVERAIGGVDQRRLILRVDRIGCDTRAQSDGAAIAGLKLEAGRLDGGPHAVADDVRLRRSRFRADHDELLPAVASGEV